jgi:hypothetical protein
MQNLSSYGYENAFWQVVTVEPFRRYRPHLLNPGVIAEPLPPGIHEMSTASSMFALGTAICLTGGRCVQGNSTPIQGFNLVGVQAVKHSVERTGGYQDKLTRMSNNRKTGLPYFNFPLREQLDKDQLHVLDALRSQFQERAPGTDPRGANTFYSFHGCRAEHVQNVCENGIVGTQSTDDGYFGSGCYSTLNVEYAARYARGDFDDPPTVRQTPTGRYPVIMFACAVAMAYPVTPKNYGNADGIPIGFSDFFARPLKQGFDCHVICVNESTGFQAVCRLDCHYVEVVMAEAQMLPVAVLWFESV